jgi:putative copper export protein
LLAAAWLTPLIARIIAKLSYIPLGTIAMCALFAAIILRAISEAYASHSSEHESPSQLQPLQTLHVIRPRLDKAELGSKSA